MREVTWSEVKKHNSKKDCWIVIEGNAYDVTKWLAIHPGGSIIASLAGQDATVFFNTSHLENVVPYLKKFLNRKLFLTSFAKIKIF